MDYSVQKWQTLYRAALFETDRSKVVPLIEQAQQVALARARQIFYESKDTVEERQALDDALYALAALKSCVRGRTEPA